MREQIKMSEQLEDMFVNKIAECLAYIAEFEREHLASNYRVCDTQRCAHGYYFIRTITVMMSDSGALFDRFDEG